MAFQKTALCIFEKIRKTLIIPSITAWPVASEISYGQKFSSSVLSGHAAATPGSFSFENPESTSTAGVVNQYVLFTLEDTFTYSSIRKELSITVNKMELKHNRDFGIGQVL